MHFEDLKVTFTILNANNFADNFFARFDFLSSTLDSQSGKNTTTGTFGQSLRINDQAPFDIFEKMHEVTGCDQNVWLNFNLSKQFQLFKINVHFF